MSSDTDLDKLFLNGVDDAEKALDLFLKNEFTNSKNLIFPKTNITIYHNVVKCGILFIEAFVVASYVKIKNAIDEVEMALLNCEKFRRKSSLREAFEKIIKKVNYDSYNEMEAHAELCFVEISIVRSLLSFMEDGSLKSLIKNALRIRSCYKTYKKCEMFIDHRTWRDERLKRHFESGVFLGIGTFDLVISLLPSKIIKILEFIGFSGNRENGLSELSRAMNTDGLRAPLCTLIFFTYHLILIYMIGEEDGNINLCEKILKKYLLKYPNGLFFLFFKARIEFCKGNFKESIQWYFRTWKTQNERPEFYVVPMWQLFWLECLMMNWNKANEYITYLLETNMWSPTMYSYHKASLLLMRENELSPEEILTINKLMKNIPKLMLESKRKVYAIEKFAVQQSEIYLTETKPPVLPIFLSMLLDNLFPFLKKNKDCANKIHEVIQREYEKNEKKTNMKYFIDDKCTLLLLKGSCLRQLKNYKNAIECLNQILDLEKQIILTNFVIPFTFVELAFIHIDKKDKNMANNLLERAKNYSGYIFESRLQFKIHSTLLNLKSNVNKSSSHKNVNKNLEKNDKSDSRKRNNKTNYSTAGPSTS